MSNDNLSPEKRLTEALRILREARRAIRKIEVERTRGAGYYHAEVDWLIREKDNIDKLMKECRDE